MTENICANADNRAQIEEQNRAEEDFPILFFELDDSQASAVLGGVSGGGGNNLSVEILKDVTLEQQLDILFGVG